mmetsp:Transcript_26682/g.40805  ORF Transcript_26682/g.40805 Transcript_26682/m.40805 type:complete len:255 (+) Transcript_26682:464-1228(+)
MPCVFVASAKFFEAAAFWIAFSFLEISFSSPALDANSNCVPSGNIIEAHVVCVFSVSDPSAASSATSGWFSFSFSRFASCSSIVSCNWPAFEKSFFLIASAISSFNEPILPSISSIVGKSSRKASSSSNLAWYVDASWNCFLAIAWERSLFEASIFFSSSALEKNDLFSSSTGATFSFSRSVSVALDGLDPFAARASFRRRFASSTEACLSAAPEKSLDAAASSTACCAELIFSSNSSIVGKSSSLILRSSNLC